jgi:hypothetical protein
MGAVFELQSTAVIARVPRWAVVGYLEAATKARAASREYDNDGGSIWAIDSAQEIQVQRTLDGLTRVIWHPILGRLYRRKARSEARVAG